MLKVCEIRDEGPARTVFRIGDGETAPDPATLERLVAVASQLLAENGLLGAFRTAAPGQVALEVAPDSRHFLHEGILFAALDAVNDPVKNPTLTLYAVAPRTD